MEENKSVPLLIALRNGVLGRQSDEDRAKSSAGSKFESVKQLFRTTISLIMDRDRDKPERHCALV